MPIEIKSKMEKIMTTGQKNVIITDPSYLCEGLVDVENADAIATLLIPPGMWEELRGAPDLTDLDDSWTFWFGGQHPSREYELVAEVAGDDSGMFCVADPKDLGDFDWDIFCEDVVGHASVNGHFPFMPLVGESGGKGLKVYARSLEGKIVSLAFHVGDDPFDWYR
jgi:hypothetical protein